MKWPDFFMGVIAVIAVIAIFATLIYTGYINGQANGKREICDLLTDEVKRPDGRVSGPLHKVCYGE